MTCTHLKVSPVRCRFVSDSSNSAPGFEMYWDSAATGCGGELTSTSGTIISPNYPLPYHSLAECTWKIHVSHGSRLTMSFVDIDLERNDQYCG